MMRLASKNSVVAADNRHVICRTNSVSLSNFTDKRREATRAPAFRGENFERDFDSNTLFYDAVQVSKSTIALFAPPFFNLARDVNVIVNLRPMPAAPTPAPRAQRRADNDSPPAPRVEPRDIEPGADLRQEAPRSGRRIDEKDPYAR